MTYPIGVTGIVSPPAGLTVYGPEATTLRTSAGNPNVRVVPVGAVTSTQITGLQSSNTYRVRIRALDAAGNASAWSDEILIVTTAPPSNPVPATVVGTAAVPTVAALVPGPAPTTVAATASVPSVRAGLQRTVTTTGTTGTATGLLPTQQYSARVRARDAAGNWSDWSTPATFTTTGSGSVAPATVTAVAAIPAPTTGGTPPTVTAGLARPVAIGSTVLLDVTATPPGGATIIGYSWAIVAGGGSLTGATTATPTYTPPGTGSGLVTVRAAVMTNNAGRATADVVVAYGPTVVAAENLLTGTPRATWDLASPNLGGVATLQGFCDGFTVNKGGTASFKIAQSDTAGWSAEVYRLGYYADNGARSYGTLTPSSGQVTASQAQPSPGDADPNTTLLSADAGNWSTTLTWAVPSWAPSGIYLLRLNRTGGGASHIMFIVRDDARAAALMFMPADSTWNAYNAWGGMGGSMYSGNSLYYGTGVDQYNSDAARFVSYNRPVVNRGAADSGRAYGAVEWSTFFTSEYGMLRFVERNGIDVKYYGCIDAGGDAAGTHLKGGAGRGGVSAAIFVGHNEYWSNVMRQGWEAARDYGVSVFSCAGNEVFWRTVGSSPDADGRPRLIECFKSTIASRASTGRTEWTGTWRDPDGAGKGGNNPENTLTGSIFVVNGPDFRAVQVPFAGGYSAQPLWRSTSVASLTTGQTYTSPSQILGFEWDTYGTGGTNTTGNNYLGPAHPRARFCSDSTYAVSSLVLTDAGDEYGSGNVTHRLVVQPGGHGGIVFGTGTVNWAFGVDSANTYQQGSDNTSTVLQQATLNILTDMGAPPTTLMSGMTQPTPVVWFPDAIVGTVAAVAAIPAASPSTVIAAAPATVAATAAVATPTVTRGAGATPATVVATASVPASTVRLGAQQTVSTVQAVAAIPAASVVTASGSTAIPSTVTATAAVPAGTTQAGSTSAPATVTATASVPAPAVRLSAALTLATVVAVATIAAPAVSTGSTTTPATVTAVAAVATPTVGTGNSPSPATVATVASVPAVAIGASTTAAPGTVTAVAGVPAPVAGSATTVTAATVTATAIVPAPAIARTATATPATVVATGTVPAASPLAAGAAAPATVVGGAAVPAVAVPLGTRPGPATVTAVAGIASPALITTAILAPATVVASTVISGTASARVTIVATTVTAFAGISGSARIGVAVAPATVAAVATVPAVRQAVGQVVTGVETVRVTGVSQTASVTGVGTTATVSGTAPTARIL